MDENKKVDIVEENTGDQAKVKTTAVDTGRRVDVGAIKPRPTFVRKRPTHSREERNPAVKEVEPTNVDTTADEQKVEPQPKVESVVAPPQTTNERREPEKRIPIYVEPLEFDESGDFAAMLAQSEDEGQKSYQVSDKVTGKIVHVGKDHTFIALSPKVEAAIATVELCDEHGQPTVRVGQKITSYVISTHGGITLSNNVAQSGLDSALLEEACAKKIPVEGKVAAVNKGGFDVQISGKRAFCPVSQIDNKFVEEPSAFVGRTLNFIIDRIEEGGKNIVVSRRSLLEREKKEKARETIKGLELNKRYEAVITRVADFGAFADIGGLEGLIPRSEIAHGHIDRVADVISSGDRVEVMVLSFDINEDEPSKSKLSFSLKKTKEDPYTLHWDKIKTGSTLEGRVVRLEAFGAFVELFPGIDGLIHISEMAESRIAHPKEILSVGDPVTVRVVTVDDQEKRIGLSLREQVTKKKGADSTAVPVKVDRGQKAQGIVSRIERYGVFLELDSGVTALLPASETGLPKNAEMSRAFSIGQSVDVVVIDVDAQNRVRVSSLARKQMEERDSYLSFQNKENERGASFGTFADLLKKRK